MLWGCIERWVSPWFFVQVGTIANLGIQVATPLPTEARIHGWSFQVWLVAGYNVPVWTIAWKQVDRWPGAIVMAKQTIYSMLLLHVSLAFATKAKEVFSAEDPQAALRKLKSESLPQAWFFVWFCWGWNFQQGRNKLGVRFKFRWCFRPGAAPNC